MAIKTISIALFLALITLFPATPAGTQCAFSIAKELNLHWQGDKGYTVQVHMDYVPRGQEVMLEVAGKTPSDSIETLLVEVFNPQEDKLASYQNLDNGISNGNDFLQFRFDPSLSQFRGWLDLGGADPGEYFLKGLPGDNLDLFYIDRSGQEVKIDHNRGQLMIVTNPPNAWFLQ